jgi:hypothetical protein
MNPRAWSPLQWTLTIVVVVGLAIDAFVHYDLAAAFANNKTSTLSEPELFRFEATVAIIAAVALVVRPRRYTAGFAFLVGAAGTVLVLVYRYVNVGKIGPIPQMYDPYWGPGAEKVLSLLGEAAAAVAALWLFAIFHQQAKAGTTTSRAPATRSVVG